MTVKNLRKILEDYPDNMEVYLAGGKTEFTYGELNSVRKETVEFREDPYADYLYVPAAYVECVILDEE